jgi:hypothetical protein
MKFRKPAGSYHAENHWQRKGTAGAGNGTGSSGYEDAGAGNSGPPIYGPFGAGYAGSSEMTGAGGCPRRRGKLIRAVRTFLRSEAGLGTLEIVLIAAVIIILVVLFRDWIIGFLQDLFDKVENETDSLFS